MKAQSFWRGEIKNGYLVSYLIRSVNSQGTAYIQCAVAVRDEYELSRFQLVASAKASWI